VEPAELARLYARSSLLLHLSECESFGLPLVEAMRFGLPVVAADRSSLPEVAGGAAALANPDDVDAVAATVEAMLADGAAGFIERGYARAAELTWRATAEGIAAVVSRVAPGS
jgi:alpha-1,3-rhamnosyl/mannosyltransferase